MIHFPIALYLSRTVFDFCARIFRKVALAEVARWNFLFAAVMSIPAGATGIMAWQWALEGKRLRGVLLLHLLLGCATVLGLRVTVWLRGRVRGDSNAATPGRLLIIEAAVCAIVAVTGHLGGVLSGVNIGL